MGAPYNLKRNYHLTDLNLLDALKQKSQIVCSLYLLMAPSNLYSQCGSIHGISI